MNKVQELLKEAASYLADQGAADPRLDAEVLLCDLLELDRLNLYAYPERDVDSGTVEEFQKLVGQRGRGMPVSRILGYKHFYNSRFIVTPDVLSPRPETEELTEVVLSSNLPAKSRVLDLCCGSGCVGLSILRERPDLFLDLADISGPALAVARQNQELVCPDSSGHARYYQGNLYETLPPDVVYQAVACNPPYIHPDEEPDLMREVSKHDPRAALYHDDPPLLYEFIFRGALERLSEGGILILELGPRFAAEILERALEFFPNAELRKDLSGVERYLYATRENPPERL